MLTDHSHKAKSLFGAADPDGATRLNLLTHDIRSAVFDVIGGLRLVDHSKIDAETRLQLERIRTSGEILARLVEDALTLVTDGMSDTESVIANLHLHRLLNDVELRWSGRAKAKGLEFELIIAPDVPAVISTDRLGLERILSNLLSNAFKYTEKGVVRMETSLADGNILKFSLCDDGPGFSNEALSSLYNLHGRPFNTEKPGTGVGLHIAKDIADRMGATIQVANGSNGAIVTLELPAKAWHYATAAQGTHPLPDLSNVRVLVAEDNETNQLIIAQMLQTMGAEYEIAIDGIEALNWLERESFDIALIDIDMPRLSGIDVMRHVRSQMTELRDLPILAVTAFVLRANRDAIYDAGANRILAKPILSIETFGQSIASLLRLAEGSIPIDEQAAARPTLDETRLNHLLEISGPEGAKELLNRLHSDLSNISDALSNAVPELDLPNLRGQTHVLISLAGAVGADRLQRQAEALNSAAHLQDESAVLALGQEAERNLNHLIDRIASEMSKEKGS